MLAGNGVPSAPPPPPAPPTCGLYDGQGDSPPAGTDGLTRLIESEQFTVRMCMEYLYLYRKNLGTRGFLVNKLHTYPVAEVGIYIPQLITLLVACPADGRTLPDVEQYVLSSCAESIHFALKALWYLESDTTTTDKLRVRLRTSLKEKMEGAAINRRRRPLSASMSVSCVESEVIAKDRLCDYFNSEMSFIIRLTKLSHELRMLPRDKRDARLMDELRRLSAFMRKKPLSLPLLSLNAPFRRVIRVPLNFPNCAKVLSSKERAPYLVLFEHLEGGSVETLGPLEIDGNEDRDATAFSYTSNATCDTPTARTQSTAGSDLGLAGRASVPSVAPEGEGQRATPKNEAATSPSHTPAGTDTINGTTTRTNTPVTPAPQSSVSPAVDRLSPFPNSPPASEKGLGANCAQARPEVSPPTSPVERHTITIGAEAPEIDDEKDYHDQELARAPNPVTPLQGSVASHTDDDKEDGDKPHEPGSTSLARAIDSVVLNDSYFENASSQPYWNGTNDTQRESREIEGMQQRLDTIFNSSWHKTVEFVRKATPYGHLPGWGVTAVIVKEGDDMRQEVLAMQLIQTLDKIWKGAEIPVRLHPYGVVVTSEDSGIMEVVTDAVSVDAAKKAMQNHLPSDKSATLLDFWHYAYGNPNTAQYLFAQRNFVESMAAYSVLVYLLQIKDRHNANILLRRDGSIVHIDFGFMLSNSPGGVNLESMPFKLSREFVDVMGGTTSDMFQYFRVLVYAAFKEACKHREQVCSIVEMMVPGPNLPCFCDSPKTALDAMKARFQPDGELSVWVRDAVDNSIEN
eukprot:gene15258-23304_t